MTAAPCTRFRIVFIKYQLNSVPGVAEVASVGGFVKQYQIDLDPMKLRAYNVALKDVVGAVQRSNNNVGAKVLEVGNTEDMVRGIGLRCCGCDRR